MTLTFDLENGSESRVTWATFVPILVFFRPLCSQPMSDVRDRQIDRRQTDRQTDISRQTASSLNALEGEA